MKKNLALFAIAAITLISCGGFTNEEDQDFGGKTRDGQKNRPGTPLPPELLKPNEGEFTREKMLYNLGLLLTKAHKDFYLQAQILRTEVALACENGNAEEAHAQFRKTALAFEVLSAAPVGPLQENGKFLFDHLTSWPLTNFCGIDRAVLFLNQNGQTDPKSLYNAKGLSAIEYLLFEKSLVSVCNARAYPALVEWSKKTAADKNQDRCALAVELAGEVEENAATLWQRWNPAEGHFAKSLVDGSRYSSLQMALNDLTDNLFRVEVLKDRKLGRPIGLHKDCLAGKCPQEAELRFSDLSLPAMEKNISSLESIYHGATKPEAKGFGLDDYLRHLGRSDVADRLSGALRSAHAAAYALRQESYQKIIAEMDSAQCGQTTRENRLVPVCALFQDVRQISILMKAELLSVLELRPPSTIEGDND